MQNLKFTGILKKDGWVCPAFVRLDKQGVILSISNKSETETQFEEIEGYALAGFQNAHSHAFQYAMVGLAEIHNRANDDFWSWRTTMYKLALALKPEDIQAVASMVYAEMVIHGYTHVAEFHYLHHDVDGNWYKDPAEIGSHLLQAANNAGIKITLVPIFYQQGGFGQDPEGNQKRFICKNPDEYFTLLQSFADLVRDHRFVNYGAGFHSLRAVNVDSLKTVLENIPDDLPIHIHVSEQKKEVEDCLDYLGARPVQWLLDNVNINHHWHLVHATYINEIELNGIVVASANVVLCPSTEGNLGDGIFPFRAFHKSHGAWAIGTDSHIGLNPLEELRLLDYGQRLISNKRDTFPSDKTKDGALAAFNAAYQVGSKAMGNSITSFFEEGNTFDAIVFDSKHPLLETSTIDHLAPTILYALGSKASLGTMVNGKWVVKSGNHIRKEKINYEFISRLKALALR